MKERPILFNDEMVRALLDGRKTQTRRIFKEQPPEGCGAIEGPQMFAPLIFVRGEAQPGPDVFGAFSEDGEWSIKCPYGQPGDRLWVRETFRGRRVDGLPGDVTYKADHPGASTVPGSYGRSWKPSIHMPRWACRLLLEVAAVRVERLQEITAEDASAEGCKPPDLPPDVTGVDGDYEADERTTFAILWNRINGAGSWDANPWVWVVEFKRIDSSEVAA